MSKLTEKDVELLKRPNLAIIGTIRADGTPQLTPTWIDTDGEHLLVNTAEGRAKPRNLRRDPRVSVSVVDHDDPYWWISITGTAELTHDGAEEHIHELSRRYRGRDYDKPQEPRRILVRITPDRISRYGD
jgi:PPOX class probable F420-dependent enzyme